jgi:hypothetical protein
MTNFIPGQHINLTPMGGDGHEVKLSALSRKADGITQTGGNISPKKNFFSAI